MAAGLGVAGAFGSAHSHCAAVTRVPRGVNLWRCFFDDGLPRPICCERGLDQPGSTSCGGDAARSNSGDDERRGPSMLKERRWRPRNFG